MAKLRLIPTLYCALFLLPFPVIAADEIPIAVSPGASRGISTVLDRCPTFSWATVPYARGFELRVLRVLGEGDDPSSLREQASEAPVIRVEVPASATSWTPSAADCLEPGEVYSWRLREVGGYGRRHGDWSEARSFAVSTPILESASWPDDAARDGRGPREAAGAPFASPDLLARLDRLEALAARGGEGGEAGASLESLERKVDALSEWLIPCTPEDYREGLCDTRGGHPLNLEFTVCGDVHLGAELAAELGVEGGIEISGGIGNATLLWGKAAGNASFPAFAVSPIGGIPIALPTSVGLDASAGGSLTLQVCLAGLTVPIGRDADDAARQIVADAQDYAEQVQAKVLDLMNGRELSFESLGDALGSIEIFDELSEIEAEDPLEIFEEGAGSVRDLIDSLPVGNWASQQLSRVEDLVPDFDPDSLFAEICNQLSTLPTTGPKVQEFCTFVEAGQLPVPQIVADIEEAVGDIEGTAGDLGGALADLGESTENVWQAVSEGTVDGVEVAIGTIEGIVTESEEAISGVVVPAVTSTKTIVQGTDAAIDGVVVPTVSAIDSTVDDIDRSVDGILVPTSQAIEGIVRDTRDRVSSVQRTSRDILSGVCDLFPFSAPSFCPD